MTERLNNEKAKRKRTIQLPVIINSAGGNNQIRRSKTSRWRALALITLTLLMIAHIIQWRLMGVTISPIEPSEAMYTLRDGAVNAGFIFFSLAILATLVFGRFVCGWGCHIVALQDLCAWLMTRIGVKPRPFRSRLLIYVPLLIAIYMFVWPTLYRFLVLPANERVIPPFTNHIITTEFWATFPTIAVAIPFLFICGFLTVYFLGSKGFCTYACPYGGVFVLADKVAPGKIRVTDACNQCGQCTTTCMSNVNVAAEVAQYGMVVDPGCMKHMDCISVCANDALYFGFGKPTILSGVPSVPEQPGELSDPPTLPAGTLVSEPGAIATGFPIASKPSTQNSKYSLTWPEEIAASLVFAASLFAVWDVYQLVPMLMALGIAAVTTFLTYILWRLANAENVRFHRFPLKSAGTIRFAGWAFAGFALVWIGMIAHSGWVRYNEREGNAAFERVRIPDELALARSDPGQWLAAGDRETIAVGTLHLYRAFDAGFIVNTFTLPKLAWLEYLSGKPEQAVKLLGIAEKRQEGQARALSLYYRGAILNRLMRHEEAVASLEAAIAVRPDLITALEEKGESLWQMGHQEEAVAAWTEAQAAYPNLPLTNYFLSGATASLGRTADAEAYEKHADALTPPDARFHWMLAMRLENVGMKQLANKHLARSIERRQAGSR